MAQHRDGEDAPELEAHAEPDTEAPDASAPAPRVDRLRMAKTPSRSSGPASRPSGPASRPSGPASRPSGPSSRPAPSLPPMSEDRRRAMEALLEAARKALAPRFEPTRLLGRGGMGVVVAAQHLALGREVAIKLIPGAALRDATARTRFEREARSAALLSHPNIVAVHDVDLEHGYIVMELCEGVSLGKRLAVEKRLSVAEVRRVGAAVLAGLQAAHEVGIIHRDVKPGNILLEPGGGVKLADFGVAYWGEDSSITRDGAFVGTPAYMPPEQLRGRAVDARADVYAAGATLFEALTGSKVHASEASVEDPRAAVLEATGDEALADAIARAVRERPEDRFESAAAFAAALTAPPPPAPPPPPPEPPPVVAEARPLEAPAPPLEGKRPARRASTLVLTLLGAAIGSAAVLAVRAKSEEPPVQAVVRAAPAPREGPVVVAMLPFEVPASLSQLDFARTGLPHLLGTELQKIQGLEVLGHYKLKSQLAEGDGPAELWTEAATKLGASHVVRGSIAASGRDALVTVSVGPPSGPPIASWNRTVSAREVPEVVRAMAGPISSAALGRDVRAEVAGGDFEQQKHYLAGIAALERSRHEEAIVELGRAVELDPRSGPAAYAYAVALWWGGRSGELVGAAIGRALALDPTETERAFLEGLALLTGRRGAEAVEHFRAASARFPDDRDVRYGQFEALFHGGHPAEAFRAYRELARRYPSFRLGTLHLLTYAITNGEPQELEWALAHAQVDQDALHLAWGPRALLGRREYARAIERLRELGERDLDPVSKVGIEETLVWAYVLDGRTELASATLAILDRQADSYYLGGHPRAALELARGDLARVATIRDVAVEKLLVDPTWPSAIDLWIQWILLELAAPEPKRVASYVHSLDVALERQGLTADPRRALLEPLLAATVPNWRWDKAAPNASVPEERALGEALLASAPSAAADAYARAARASGDGRFTIVARFLEARSRRAARDPGGVIEACDEVVRPRLFNWSWGALVGDCLLYTVEAAKALGDQARASSAAARLTALRGGAGAGDRLLRGLAKLER